MVLLPVPCTGEGRVRGELDRHPGGHAGHYDLGGPPLPAQRVPPLGSHEKRHRQLVATKERQPGGAEQGRGTHLHGGKDMDQRHPSTERERCAPLTLYNDTLQDESVSFLLVEGKDDSVSPMRKVWGRGMFHQPLCFCYKYFSTLLEVFCFPACRALLTHSVTALHVTA